MSTSTPTLKQFIAQSLQDVCDAIDDVRRDRAAKPNKTPLFGSKEALPAIDFDLAVAADPNDPHTKIIVLGAMSSDHPSVPLVAAPGPSRIKFRVSLAPDAEPKREFSRDNNNRRPHDHDDERPRRDYRGGGDGGDRPRGPRPDRDFGPRKRSFGDEGRPPRRFD